MGLKNLVTALLGLLVILVTGTAAALDLTGTWEGNDGGTYYLRQLGNELYWFGERSATDPAWSNVFYGRVQGDRVRGDWSDVPKGRARSNGKLLLEIRAGGNELVAVQKTGGFGGSVWKRENAPLAVAPVPIAPMEDCVSFDPRNAQVRLINNGWKIVDGSHWMFDFGPRQSEAQRALQVIRRYQANRSCFVGRPGPSLTYLLVGDQAPQGAFAGEDCVGFNLATITVAQVGGHWKVVDGGHWMFDFQSKENEARQALAIIKHHGFNRSCFVGRPNPSFSYLRR